MSKPSHTNSSDLFQTAIASLQNGKIDDAERLFRRVLHAQPTHFGALNLLGILLIQLGNYQEAEHFILRALGVNKSSDVTFYNYGILLKNMNRLTEALTQFDRALAINASVPDTWNNRGSVLNDLERFEEALKDLERAIALNPVFSGAYYNKGNSFHGLKRYEEAIISYDKALSLNPSDVAALNNRGNSLFKLKRFDDARASYNRAITIQPGFLSSYVGLGDVLFENKRYDEALSAYKTVLSNGAGSAEAWLGQGNVFVEWRRFDDAFAVYDKALALNPNFVEAWLGRGSIFFELSRFNEALASFDRALTIKPNHVAALFSRAIALMGLKRWTEALACLNQVLVLKSDHPHAFSHAARCKFNLCHWQDAEHLVEELGVHIAEQRSTINPQFYLAVSDNLELQQKCAENFVKHSSGPAAPTFYESSTTRRRAEPLPYRKIRIAYISADFRVHATAYLIAELFEIHNRAQFEVIGISLGLNDQSEMRLRLVNAFDQFHDVSLENDRSIAELINKLEVDIAIDLHGHTLGSRTGIFTFRPAPLQVNYLGYPGTLGVGFIDYVIADKVVVPENHQNFYTENIAWLPDCYQVNDSKRKISSRIPTRGEMELPDRGFIFCCFNNNLKITPSVFDVWMRLLAKVDGSVFWLLHSSDETSNNLRRAAETRGVAPDRLIFAPFAPLEDHLARHHLADLFLDTLPYNAHTTASDALWAGLPVLTCKGNAFAGRVAASLLHAVGLPELVTNNLEEYEALALEFATNPARLQAIRDKLEANRLTYPLFDTDRFRRHIEKAYTTMWDIHQRGESPRSFSVEPN